MASRFATALLAIAGLACATSCRDILGIETRAEGPSLLALGETCGACVDETCPDAERACAADPACGTLVECLSAAGVDAVEGRQQCAAEHPEGRESPGYAAMDACLRGGCQASCFGSKGFFARHEAKCESCANEACLPEMAGCVADRACEANVHRAVGDPDAIDPPGALAFTNAFAGRPEFALDLCAASECAKACRLDGNNLDCLSNYAWPEPQSTQVTVEFAAQVRPFPGFESALARASVDFCGDPLEACSSPLFSATSDAEGIVRAPLIVPELSGFRGYVQVRDGASGHELFPTRVLRARPVSADQRYGQIVPTVLNADQVEVALGITIDPARGHLGAVFLDCANKFVPGMKIELPEAALQGATITYGAGSDVTLEEGVMVLNVQPGCHEFVGTLDGVEKHRALTFVEAGTLSVTYLNPIDEVGDLGVICEPMFSW